MIETRTSPQLDLEGLVKDHQVAIWRYLRFLGCDESSADDLTQETFLRVMNRALKNDSPGAVRAYLRTTAKNLFISERKRNLREPSLAELEIADEVWTETNPDDDDAAYLDALNDCLESVAGRSNEALQLRYREGLGRAEIAKRLKISPEGVKTLLRRTRDQLRQCIERKLR